MCSDLLALGKDIRILEENGVDMLHVDVMDAHFVPNLTFGPDFIQAMQRWTDLPLDCHFMVTDPRQMLDKIRLRPQDLFTAHVEVEADHEALAAEVHRCGARFGLAVSPDTPVEALEPHLGYIDTTTLMLVHPGFAGAKMVEGIMEKVGHCRTFLDGHGHPEIEISVDGSVSCERAAYMAGLGASIFVGGTAGIYRKGMDLRETIPTFRSFIS